MHSTLFFVLLLTFSTGTCNAFSSQPKGSAAKPLDKKKIAVIGAGGYMGAMTFGFLQRAASLYETGVARQCRCIGATSATATALNLVLGKHFVLAQADETFIQLTNLESVSAIQKSLEGYDAVILGDSMVAQSRPVTSGTFEQGPNAKTTEVYWDTYRGNEMTTETEPEVRKIIDNILEACKGSQVKHIVAVATPGGCENFTTKVQACGVPSTVLQCPGTLVNQKDYTYRKGVQGNLQASSSPSSASGSGEIFREDVAAMCVQSLQVLDWSKSRTLQLESTGPLDLVRPSSKRPDQEWCVNSHALAGALLSTV